tara:strand:+ start:249 stop:557 length:309 start_codon:yes stop_codon:yes gene_type:complete
MPTTSGTSVDLKTLATAGSLLALLFGAAGTASVAIYRVGHAETEILDHVKISGHSPVVSQVESQKETLDQLKERLDVIQASVNKNERNQIRICIAVGADCER